MKGQAQRLIDFFDGSKTHLIIPLYQRNYDWREENCKQLFDDLLALHRQQRRSHFFGSIVAQVDPETLARYIIDGQQRLTTVSLLLIAMANAHKAGALIAEEQTAGDDIIADYIVNTTERKGRKIKLQPIERDLKAYDVLLTGVKERFDKTSNVTRNYNYLYERAITCGLTLDELRKAIERLEVVSINLGPDDDPQLIFESLNSTGLDLSEADKVRNYLLMSQQPQVQEDFYCHYWHPLEECTAYEPTSFLRDYLTLQRGNITKTNRIYATFKAYDAARQLSRKDLLGDLLHYAQIFHAIATGTFPDKVVNAKLCQMAPLGLNVAYPFLMAFFDYAQAQGLSPTTQWEVLHLVENYWVRRLICNRPSNALSKVFMTLHRDVVKFLAAAPAETSYVPVATYLLRLRSGSGELPRDAEVSQALATRNVYKMPSGAREFLFERFENQDSKEMRCEIAQGLKDGSISIEHIMPQTLTKEWKEALGPDWERIHRDYCHTLANLTVTAPDYNTKYSNAPFPVKRDMKDGFANTTYRLNAYVRTCSQWTEAELRERGRQQIEIFMRLWPEPQTDFAPAAPPADTASLDDEEFEGTGRSLRAYIYRGERHEASSWITMLIEVSKLAYDDHSAAVTQLCANGQWRFFNHSAHGRSEFAPGFYVHTSSSTAEKLRVLRHLFDACNIPAEELVFELRPMQTIAKEDEDDDGDGQQLLPFSNN